MIRELGGGWLMVKRRQFIRLGIGIVGAAAVGDALAACAPAAAPAPSASATPPPPTPAPSKSPDLAAANREGKVRFYHPGGAVTIGTVLVAFKKAYPTIAVEDVGDPIAVFISDAKAGTADVVFASEADLQATVTQDALAAYVPNDTDWVAAEFKDKAGRWIEDLPVLAGITYNTSQLTKDQAPKTFKELLDPKWKGKIGYIDLRQGPLASVAIDNFAALAREYGDDYIHALAAQKIRFYPGGAEIRNAVAAGEVLISPASNFASVETLKATGKSIDWVRATDNAYITSVSFVGIAAKAAHPNAAMLFVDYFFSKEGMQVLADGNFIVGRPGITLKNPDQSPVGKKLLHAVPLPDADRKAFLEKYKDLFA
jgi:iron(III) transport system substrate-binding protein